MRDVLYLVLVKQVMSGLINFDYENLESVLEKMEFIKVKNSKRNNMVMVFVLLWLYLKVYVV